MILSTTVSNHHLCDLSDNLCKLAVLALSSIKKKVMYTPGIARECAQRLKAVKDGEWQAPRAQI